MSDKPSWSRRRFLTARGLGASAGGLIGKVIPSEPPIPIADQPGFGHWSVSRRAMGCDFTVYLPPMGPDPLPIANIALTEIADAENLLTAYRADSPLSYINAHAADGPVRTHARLFKLLKRAAMLSETTEYAFDVSAGSLVRAWGFLNGPKRVPSDAEITDALACSGMQHVLLDDHDETVAFNVAGLEINLGSIGKGLGIDLAMERLRTECELRCAMIQGGQSSIRAMGEPAGKGSGWLVGIQNPFDANQRLATLRLRDRAMGTSGGANQYFEANGRRYGHIIDPRTGHPVDGLGSVTVLADDAATADGLATALFVMGLDKAADFCHNNPNIAALLVLKPAPDGDPNLLPRIVTFNLPPEDIELQPGS